MAQLQPPRSSTIKFHDLPKADIPNWVLYDNVVQKSFVSHAFVRFPHLLANGLPATADNLFLTILPGEIRNRIYTFCAKADPYEIDISAPGPDHFRLPAHSLILTNKQIAKEYLSILWDERMIKIQFSYQQMSREPWPGRNGRSYSLTSSGRLRLQGLARVIQYWNGAIKQVKVVVPHNFSRELYFAMERIQAFLDTFPALERFHLVSDNLGVGRDPRHRADAYEISTRRLRKKFLQDVMVYLQGSRPVNADWTSICPRVLNSFTICWIERLSRQGIVQAEQWVVERSNTSWAQNGQIRQNWKVVVETTSTSGISLMDRVFCGYGTNVIGCRKYLGY